MQEQKSIQGYLTKKEILHSFTIALGWFISSGILTYLSNNEKFVPVISVLASFLAALYSILKRLDSGTPINQVRLNKIMEQEELNDRK